MSLVLLLVGIGDARAGGMDRRWLLAFAACDRDSCAQPAYHRVYLAQSEGGPRFSIVPGWTPYPGSVPDVIRRGNRVYVYTPGEVRRAEADAESWGPPVPLRLVDHGGAATMGADPCAVSVDGRIHLFLLEGARGGDPARCAPGEARCTKRILLAREDAGADGASFAVDGQAVLEVSVKGHGDSASDPDVFALPDGGFALLLSRGMAVEAFTASRLEGPWSRLGMLTEQGTGGVPAAYMLGQRLFTYVSSNLPGGGSIVRRAQSRVLSTLIASHEFHPIYPGIWGRRWVSSPSIALNAP